MDSPYGGSVVTTATTTPGKTRQRGHSLCKLSFATTLLYSIFLLDSIVTWLVFSYYPPCNILADLPSIPTIGVIPTTYYSPGIRNSLLRIVVAGRGY